MKTKFISRRVKALAILWKGGVDPFYKGFKACYRTVADAMKAGEAGPALAREFERELGPDGWRWATGQTDTLIDTKRAEREPAAPGAEA